MRNLNYVAIEGAIGVGKTSLAKLLSDRLGAKLVLEKFEAVSYTHLTLPTSDLV